MLGMVPSELCDIGGLSTLSFENNSDITCYAECLNSVSNLTVGAVGECDVIVSQDAALCAFVAATNIVDVWGYSDWVCNSTGLPATDPCASWSGLYCIGDEIAFFSIYGYDMLSGTLPSELAALSSLWSLTIGASILTGATYVAYYVVG